MNTSLVSNTGPVLALAGVGQIELLRYFSKSASTFTKRFDFEDSMIEPVERFFRAFGAKQMPYFQVSKINARLLRLGQAGRKI